MNQSNQNSYNTERAMVPVGNSNQARSSNVNNTRALVVQADKNCDWSAQLGSGDSGGTTCYAKVIQPIKYVQNGDSSEDEGTSGYSETSDEESSSSSEDGIEEVSFETSDADVEKLLTFGSDDGYYSHHFAFMANVDGQSSQVCSDKPTNVTCDRCVELGAKLSELEGKYDMTFIHNQKLIVDLSKSIEANMFLMKTEKEFKNAIETLRKDLSEVTKIVTTKQTVINNYINMLEETKKKLACVKCENEAIQLKIDSYSNSRYVLDDII
ncbi:hypothetical protein Hanom_Chr13g01226371 [Helianthus anomalus]